MTTAPEFRYYCTLKPLESKGKRKSASICSNKIGKYIDRPGWATFFWQNFFVFIEHPAGFGFLTLFSIEDNVESEVVQFFEAGLKIAQDTACFCAKWSKWHFHFAFCLGLKCSVGIQNAIYESSNFSRKCSPFLMRESDENWLRLCVGGSFYTSGHWQLGQSDLNMHWLGYPRKKIAFLALPALKETHTQQHPRMLRLNFCMTLAPGKERHMLHLPHTNWRLLKKGRRSNIEDHHSTAPA